MKCPNKNLQGYIDLVNKYGEFSAMKAYVLNNEEIPTVEEADRLLKGLSYSQFNNSVQELKQRFSVAGVKYDSFERANIRAKGINDYINSQDTPVNYRAKAGKNTAGEYVITFVPSSGNTMYQNVNTEGQVASEKTIRDLASRLADRIGYNVKFESDRSKEYKGKLKGTTAVVNLAHATLDTPIHEILGHPIIRAIKNRGNYYKVGQSALFHGYGDPERVTITKIFDDTLDVEFKDSNGNIQKASLFELTETQNTLLYQNLLKELEYGAGKEVLDRIKKDYNIKIIEDEDLRRVSGEDFDTKFKNKGYILVDEVRESSGKLRYLVIKKEKLETAYYTIEEQQEEAIVELLGLMTSNKLDAVKDGKLISLLKRLLKEIKVFVRDLLKQREVEVDKLPDTMTLGDLADLLAYSNSKLVLPGYEVEYTTPDNQHFKTYAEASKHISDLAKNIENVDLDNVLLNIPKRAETVDQIPVTKLEDDFSGDKFFKENNSWYRLDQIGEDKYKAVPADDYIVLQAWNYGVSQNNASKQSVLGFIQKNKEYEKSKEIVEEWKKVNNIQYNPEEIYSRGQEFVSVVGAYSAFDVNLMMQNLLAHIEDNEKAGGKFAISAFTKPIDQKIGHLEGGGGKIKFKIYPKSADVLWAANTDVYSGSVWDASEKVNKDKKSELLGVSYTKYPALQNVGSVTPNLADVIEDLAHHHNELGIVLTGNNFRLEYDEDIPYATKKIIDGINSILDQRYGKLTKPNTRIKRYARILDSDEFEEVSGRDYEGSLAKIGVQPTQTDSTIKESIGSIQRKITQDLKLFKNGDFWVVIDETTRKALLSTEAKEEAEAYISKYPKHAEKDYTSQALINTKISRLKEAAKKYPRNLIRSEVKMLPGASAGEKYMFSEAEGLPFQKVPMASQVLQHKYPMLGGEVKSDYEEKKQLFQKTLGVQAVEDPSLPDLGQVTTVNGKRLIKINPLLATKDTIGHEFGHILIDILGGVDSPLCKRGLQILEGTELEANVRRLYPDVSDEILKHEILAQAIGEDSVKLFAEEAKRNSFERWLARIFERLRQLLGVEKSAIRKLTRMMFDGPKTSSEQLPDITEDYQQRKSELVTEKKLVQKAIDTVIRKKALYEHTGRRSAIEKMDELLGEMATKDYKEALMKFTAFAEKQIGSINTLYARELKKEQEGKPAFDIATLKRWNEYLSAFEVLNDINDFLADNPELSLSSENRVRLNEAIAKRNQLSSLYTKKGFGKLVDKLMPYSTRSEAEIKREIERRYNTLTKEDRSKISLLEYQNQELAKRTDEIDERKRNLIETELEKASRDINQIYRWADNLLDSNDVIISAAVKMLVVADDQARLVSLKTRNKIVDALRELETVIKHNPVAGEEQFYDFMIEKDSLGKPTGYLVSEYKSALVQDYYAAKNQADQIEDPIARRQFMFDWYNANAPINSGLFKDNVQAYYTKLQTEGILTEADVSTLMYRFTARRTDPIKLKTVSELVGQEKADAIDDGMSDVIWSSRKIDAKYKNPEWTKLENIRKVNPLDPRIKFYNLMLKISDEGDNNLPNKYKLNFHGLMYRMPSVGKDTRERTKDKGIKGFIEGQKVGLVKRPEDIERGQQELVGENNEPIDFIPIFYTQKLPIEDLSFDLATSYARFYDMSAHYAAKSEILPEMELARHFIHTREVTRTDAKGNPLKNALKMLEDKELTKNGQQSLIAAQFEDWYRTIMYGQSKVDEGEFNVFGLQVDKGKAMDMLGRYSAFNLLALNAIQGAGNVILGETMQAIEAFAGEHMTKASYTKASRLFAQNLPSFLGDIGSRKPVSLLGVLNETFAVVNESMEPMRRNTKFRSMLTMNSLFFMQHAGEFEMQMRFFLGMLSDLDAKNSEGAIIGKMIDFISVKDGELVVKPEVANFTDKDKVKFGQKAKRIISRMHGEYSHYGVVALQRYGIGKLVLAFRKFIIPGFKRRWAKEAYNEMSGSFTEGNYITTAKFARTLMKDMKAFKLSLVTVEWEKLTRAEKANIYRTMSEIAFMTAGIILSTIFLTLAKEADDDEDKKWSFAAYQAARYMAELQFFVNPVAALSILKSPMASMSVVENSIKLLTQLADPTERYERGPWKDELKIKKDLINLTIGVRQYYRLRDIEQQLNYFNQ